MILRSLVFRTARQSTLPTVATGLIRRNGKSSTTRRMSADFDRQYLQALRQHTQLFSGDEVPVEHPVRLAPWLFGGAFLLLLFLFEHAIDKRDRPLREKVVVHLKSRFQTETPDDSEAFRAVAEQASIHAVFIDHENGIVGKAFEEMRSGTLRQTAGREIDTLIRDTYDGLRRVANGEKKKPKKEKPRYPAVNELNRTYEHGDNALEDEVDTMARDSWNILCELYSKLAKLDERAFGTLAGKCQRVPLGCGLMAGLGSLPRRYPSSSAATDVTTKHLSEK